MDPEVAVSILPATTVQHAHPFFCSKVSIVKKRVVCKDEIFFAKKGLIHVGQHAVSVSNFQYPALVGSIEL
jgi:hypothetical protein